MECKNSHVVAYAFTLPYPPPPIPSELAQLHNRIFVVTTSYGRNDGSFIRHSAEKCAGKFLDVAELGDVEAAEAVAREKPDIFVDLMAHTTGARCDVFGSFGK